MDTARAQIARGRTPHGCAASFRGTEMDIMTSPEARAPPSMPLGQVSA